MTTSSVTASPPVMSTPLAPQPRVGCRRCFYTLDSAVPDDSRRTFVRCEHCSAAYHSVCWRGTCVQCEATTARPLLLPVPPECSARVRRPIALKPARGFDAPVPEPAAWSLLIEKTVRELSIDLPLALLFVGLASFVGSVADRVLRLERLSAQSVLDAVLRGPPPDMVVVWLCLVAALWTAYWLWPGGVSTRGIRFVAGSLFTGVLSAMLLNLSLLAWPTWLPYWNQMPGVRAAVVGELTTFCVLLLLTPFYHRATHVPVRSFRRPTVVVYAQQALTLVRYIVAATLTAVFAVSVTLLQPEVLAAITLPARRQAPWPLLVAILAVTVICAGIALLLYHPAPHVPLNRWRSAQWALRLCSALACGLVFVLLYTSSAAGGSLAEASAVALLVSSSLLFVPRALS